MYVYSDETAEVIRKAWHVLGHYDHHERKSGNIEGNDPPPISNDSKVSTGQS